MKEFWQSLDIVEKTLSILLVTFVTMALVGLVGKIVQFIIQ